MKIRETGFDDAGCINRNSIESLRGKTIATITTEGHYLVFSDKHRNKLFSVEWSNLFDPSGNRFQEI